MHSKTSETDRVGFGRAMAELLVVAVVAYCFAFGMDWALTGVFDAASVHLHVTHPAPAPGPAGAPPAGH